MENDIKAKKLVKIVLDNRRKIEDISQRTINLYNEIGVKENDSSLQLGFLGILIVQILKSSNANKKDLIQLLENIKQKV